MNSLSLAASVGPLSNWQQLHPSCTLFQPSSSSIHYDGHGLSYPSFRLPSVRTSSSCSRAVSVCSSLPTDEGVVSVMSFEELMEKDWSFLEPGDDAISKEDYDRKTNRVIAAGKVGDESRILISLGSDDFVDRVVDTLANQFLLVVHDSLLMLAGIVERYDTVKCWQGELTYVPEKWAPFDVVFLYCLPALPFKLDEIFGVLSSRCAPGARVVISHLEGRKGLEQQKQQFGDAIVAELPDKATLGKAAADHSFSVVEYAEDPTFYLAVLELKART